MSTRKPAPSTAVKLILEAFNTPRETGLSTKDAYNLLAKLEGFKDWAHAAPSLSKGKKDTPVTPSLGVDYDTIKDWPVYTVFPSGAGDYDEDQAFFWILPQGVELDSRVRRYGHFDAEGAKFFPTFRSSKSLEGAAMDNLILSSVVVTNIHSVIPRTEKYGIPYYANELGAHDWVVETLGWNYVAIPSARGSLRSNIEVSFMDSGDDGGGKFYLQIAVAPELAKLLEEDLAKVEPAEQDE